MIYSPYSKTIARSSAYLIIILAILTLIGIGYLASPRVTNVPLAMTNRYGQTQAAMPVSTSPEGRIMSYHTNIIKAAQDNTDFRRVIFTGPNSQLVLMSVPPGGEVGAEIHKYTEQTLFFLSGTGVGTLDDEQFPIGPGDVVVVTAGTNHNFQNTGEEPLKIYTVYAPPNHIDGRIHQTKANADADVADEAVGETAPKK